jgi:hypothetical protein
MLGLNYEVNDYRLADNVSELIVSDLGGGTKTNLFPFSSTLRH